MTHPTLTLLKKATKGLLFMSEKDAPLKAILVGAERVDRANVASLVGAPADAAVETAEFDPTFAPFAQVEKWHGEDERAYVKKFKHFLEVVRENLSEVKVYKIGERIRKIVVAGKASDGTWLAVTTESLET